MSIERRNKESVCVGVRSGFGGFTNNWWQPARDRAVLETSSGRPKATQHSLRPFFSVVVESKDFGEVW